MSRGAPWRPARRDQAGSGAPAVPPVVIRAADTDDVSAIAAFQTACWNEAYAGLVPARYLDRVTREDREVRWRERLLTGARRVAVAERAGTVVGVTSWSGPAVEEQVTTELKSLYVDAGDRGSGLAGRLLEHALGGRSAVLWVFRDNLRAQTFYRKHGFALDGSVTVDEDTGLPEVRMGRRGADRAPRT